MPPFRTGLLKRRNDLTNEKSKTVKNTSDEESSNSEAEDLIKGEFNLEDDETDSEKEDGDVESEDDLQDEVPEGDNEDDDEEEEQPLSDESSELTDSEEDDDSEKEGSGTDSDKASDKQEKEEDSDSDSPTNSSEPDEKSVDRLAQSIQKATVSTHPVSAKDEYESGDTSDEEDRRTTTGAVPAWWYRDLPHVGYDTAARRVLRPPQRDHIDEFLRRCEDPDFWRTVRDPATGQDVVLAEGDLRLLARLRAGHAPHGAEADHFPPWVEWFTRDVLATPVRAFPDHKRSFLPSRDEQRAVSRLVHALRMGWLKTRRELAAERAARRAKRFYDLWGAGAGADDKLRGVHRHIPAPRRAPPSHAESYNPPPEYLLDEAEMKEWNALAETPWKRKYTFLPTRHANLRSVAGYPRFTRERFLRCLDLYLAPRAIKMRLTVRPDDLVPRLPAPRDLRPFPAAEALAFRGHTDIVRCCDFDPSGQYAVSGGDDRTVRVWEVASGRCLRTLAVAAAVARVAWTPAAGLALVAVAAGPDLLLWNPGAGVGAHRVAARTDELLEEPPPGAAPAADARTAGAARWARVAPEQWARGVRLLVTHFRPVTHVSWHARGDYLAATLADAAARSVVVHQVSRRRSQLPFARAKGLVQCAVFHPTRPQLFVATQRAVRVYDLVRGELLRKLRPGAQWLSSLALHPGGEHLLAGAYDRKAAWFDLELSAAPYRTLRLHGGAVRAVAFHARYPLWGSAGDDGAVVGHGAVFADLLRDPLVVPLRRLAVPRDAAGSLAALHLAFHPTQPWLLVAAADHTLRLYT